MSLIKKSERDWQAEEDANTLSRAEEIKADKARMKSAADAARRMQEDAEIRAKALKRIAKKGSSPKKSGRVKMSEW